MRIVALEVAQVGDLLGNNRFLHRRVTLTGVKELCSRRGLGRSAQPADHCCLADVPGGRTQGRRRLCGSMEGTKPAPIPADLNGSGRPSSDAKV